MLLEGFRLKPPGGAHEETDRLTLIELLLVLAIIGIIAAIAIPALLGQRTRAKAKAVQSMVSNAAGESARVSDTLKETGATPTAANVVDSVLAMSNYQYPAAKNPYGSTLNPYVSGSAQTLGQVGMEGLDNYLDPGTNRSFAAVILRGVYLDPNTNSNVTTVKVVALD